MSIQKEKTKLVSNNKSSYRTDKITEDDDERY